MIVAEGVVIGTSLDAVRDDIGTFEIMSTVGDMRCASAVADMPRIGQWVRVSIEMIEKPAFEPKEK